MPLAVRVAHKFLSAQMQRTNPYRPSKPSDKDETPQQIKDRAKQVKEKTDALKDLQKAQNEFEKAQKKLPLKFAQNPNDDPQELFNQVLPLVRRMGINNMVDRNRTQIIPGRTRNEDSLFKIVLRRNAEFDPETIARINRNSDNLEVIQWSAQAIEVYVWWPYEAPPGETVPEAPTT
jgi:hypothetical protein